MSIQQKINDLERRLDEVGSSATAVCRQANVARSTWQRWKCGATSPNLSTWQIVEDAANSILSTAQQDRGAA